MSLSRDNVFTLQQDQTDREKRLDLDIDQVGDIEAQRIVERLKVNKETLLTTFLDVDSLLTECIRMRLFLSRSQIQSVEKSMREQMKFLLVCVS